MALIRNKPWPNTGHLTWPLRRLTTLVSFCLSIVTFKFNNDVRGVIPVHVP